MWNTAYQRIVMENGLLALMPTFIWWCLLVWGPYGFVSHLCWKGRRAGMRFSPFPTLFFSPFLLLDSLKKCIPGLRRRSFCYSQTVQPLHVFVCPLEAHSEAKQIASRCIWNDLIFHYFQKIQKQRRSVHFLLCWRNEKEESFIGKVCRIEFPNARKCARRPLERLNSRSVVLSQYLKNH